MDFAWKIIGQTKIINNLIDLKNRNILPNSFIFSGPDGIGKRTLALEFAKFLNCSYSNDCDSCSRLDSFNHPDCIFIDSNSQCSDTSCCKGSSSTIIKNCVINEKIISSIKFSALVGNYKVMVINEADKLSKISYESLLKTLEEVNGNIIIVLLVDNISNIPETIISRCQLWKLENISQNKLKEELTNKFPDKNNDIDKVISFGSPTIGDSIEMLTDSIFFEERQSCIERTINMLSSPKSKKLEYSKELSTIYRKDKDRLFFELSIWKKLFYEILISKNLEYLVNNFEMFENIISLNKDKLIKNIKLIRKTENMMKKNVNPTLCLDNMVLGLEAS